MGECITKILFTFLCSPNWHWNLAAASQFVRVGPKQGLQKLATKFWDGAKMVVFFGTGNVAVGTGNVAVWSANVAVAKNYIFRKYLEK